MLGSGWALGAAEMDDTAAHNRRTVYGEKTRPADSAARCDESQPSRWALIELRSGVAWRLPGAGRAQWLGIKKLFHMQDRDGAAAKGMRNMQRKKEE